MFQVDIRLSASTMNEWSFLYILIVQSNIIIIIIIKCHLSCNIIAFRCWITISIRRFMKLRYILYLLYKFNNKFDLKKSSQKLGLSNTAQFKMKAEILYKGEAMSSTETNFYDGHL